ncbi:MAG: hypothetical protein GY699_01425 [Desulfobacteraceae bacterium]|nr:hypothetical protein [Desulfobacteraceae bacterium]
MRKVKSVCLIIVLTSFVLSCVLPLKMVSAESGKIIPFISIKQEYTDNVLFSSNNEQDDFITTATGGLILSHDSERVDANLDARIKHLFYIDNDQLDATDWSTTGKWDYTATEKMGLGATAAYRKDSRRGSDTDTTGLILSGDRKKADFGLSTSYMLSELTLGKLSAGYGFAQTEQVNSDEDNKTISANLSFTKNLSKTFKNTTGLLNFSYLHYASDSQTIVPGAITTTSYRDFTSDVFQIYAGFSKAITELYSVYLQAGSSYTDTTEGTRILQTVGAVSIETISPDEDSQTWGGVLLTGLNYDGLYYDVGVSASHDVRGASGTNGTSERSAVSLNINKKVTEDFSLTLDTSCYLNKNERRTQADLDQLTMNVQPGFRLKFWDTFTLSGVYRYTTVENRQNDTTSERNLVYLEIRKNFEL